MMIEFRLDLPAMSGVPAGSARLIVESIPHPLDLDSDFIITRGAQKATLGVDNICLERENGAQKIVICCNIQGMRHPNSPKDRAEVLEILAADGWEIEVPRSNS